MVLVVINYYVISNKASLSALHQLCHCFLYPIVYKVQLQTCGRYYEALRLTKARFSD